jgi:hypothetical protein
MLSRDEAEKRLKTFHIKNWEKDRLAAFGALPKGLCEVGRFLLDRDAAGKPFRNWMKRHEIEGRIKKQLSELPARDRKRIFAVLFPKLVDHLEAAWQFLGRLPYETDYDRKAFRAPGMPAAYREARFTWIGQIIGALRGYNEDITWCAAWAAHLSGYYGADQFGILLAAAIDAGGARGEEVFTILKESATNEHEIGSMGRHVSRALLVASRPEGWEFIERLLLAAQRQEGLRQVILESIDEAHPTAFRRMLRLILENNLLRFSSVVRAIDVWFGLRWDSLTPAVLKRTVETVLRYLEEPAARDEAIGKETGEPLYIALWSLAFDDAGAAIPKAAALLKGPAVERRFVAVHFLEQLGLPAARQELLACLDDEDLRIALKAYAGARSSDEESKDRPDLWDAVIRLLERTPTRRQELPALVWPWATTDADRADLAGDLVEYLGQRPATALLPYLKDMNGYGRVQTLEMLIKLKRWDAATRDAMFSLVGDRDGWVRSRALEALKKCDVTEEDAVRIEGLLTRKGSELRQGVLGLLKKQKTPQALASADRLLASKKQPQRLSGLELLRQLVEKKRAVDACRERARAYQERFPQPEEEEQLHLDAILDVKRVVPTLDDGLGLMDPSARSKPTAPQPRKVVLCTPATMACLKALDQLLIDNRRTPVTIKTYEGPEETLLGNVEYYEFPSPQAHRPIEEDLERLPLREVWEKWYADRPKGQRDRDGLELLRASVWWNRDPAEWKRLQKQFSKKWGDWLTFMLNGQTPIKLKHGALVGEIIQWLLRLHPPQGAADFLLDALETGYAMVPDDLRKKVVDLDDWRVRDRDWRTHSPIEPWWQEIESYRRLVPTAFADQHQLRLWQLMHWRDQPEPGVGRMRPDLAYLVAGFHAGQANDTDVIDQLIGPRRHSFDELERLSQPTAVELVQAPGLVPIVDRVKERILEIELARGELPTAASQPAGAIESLTGMATLFRILRTLSKKPFARNAWTSEGRTEVLTHLLQVTRPGPDETVEMFAGRVKEAGLEQDRLLQLGFAAPQWLDHIEHTVGWPGLKEGVWWFLAHMPSGRSGLGYEADDDDDWDFDDEDFDNEESQPQERRLSPWESALSERTPLSAADRRLGAVDAAWFHRVHEPLGKRRWDLLAAAAKYGCTDNSHKKAIHLAEVLLGQAKKSELIANIRDRKLKESVRLLGLFPLAEGERRQADLLARYKVLVEYRRYARSLGPMSREDAVRTSHVGLENLARTAGYPDPMRLEWAMEAAQLADLAAGPVSVTQDGVTVTLAIDAEAQPELTVRRGEKPLKAIPPAVRKQPKVAALAERRTELKRSASRVKNSLEAAMIRGDTFSAAELKQLFSHPLLRPLLEKLVLIGEGIVGFPVAQGQALEGHDGKLEPIKVGETLRIAHAHDLYSGGQWDRWQHNCFTRERVQPFKQVFRELYLVTKQEQADGNVSHRYAGQQVNPSQAMALWGSRGWVTREGVRKTFHDLGLVVEVSFRHHGWTAAQVEGLTLEGIEFRRRGDYRTIALTEVPAIIFSEVMRDCDLVVSVAHRGGVDPEASASTVEMREALLRETCSLLGISNYRIKNHHVLIDGKLANYSVHLGSAVVHRQPGGSVCIVPVHAQHRGRLFLPFADDDPRTAEVISKVLLLARDHEIQDPSILEQLR